MKIFADHDSRLATLEKKVGLFVFAAVGALLLLVAIIAIEQGMFASTTPLRFQTNDASKLHDGMEIRLSGFKVGKVVSIVLKDDGVIEANLSINNRYLAHIRHGAKLRLVEQSLLGDGILEVIPGERDQPALALGEVLPFERQLGMDALAHDLVDRLKPILDNVAKTTEAINQPDGLLQQAKSVAQSVRQSSDSANRLIMQTEQLMGNNGQKISQVLDKTEMLLGKSDDVLTNVQKITDEAGKITAQVSKLTSASSGELLPLIRDARVAAEDARDVIDASKQVWPIRNFINAGEVQMLPMDSYGVVHAPAK
ncbi:MAG: MlaD family protein [Gallionella sp.]|nr:MlaD family protein [Gallionella sp.]